MTIDQVVVDATAGPLPETVEQLSGLQARGASTIEVVIRNSDRVDAELLELVELEIQDLAEQHGLTVGSITRDCHGTPGEPSIYGPPS
jgi:translation elongation factor EF-Tu-like GTPase